ncbi:MAG: Do family serine endopeptidase [Acidobacteria bacterium]|nr:Do family serine endopeptidase [Acidobacteriota bacterium]
MREMMSWARQRKIAATMLVAFTLVIGIMIGTVVSDRVSSASKTQSRNGDSGAALLSVPSPVQLSSTFATISTKIEPAVVNISTTSKIEKPKPSQRRRQGNQGQGQGQNQDQFQDFFDRFFDNPDRSPQPDRSLGSGVIVDKKGFILTNNHVVDEASRIQVKLYGEQTLYDAKVVGVDRETDLAVIKIEAPKELSTAKLGNSEGIQVGDWVLAFGSPFGLDATVTAGIISAKDRDPIPGAGQFQRFIQTDAAINPGNSGGPLVNMNGEVIGINTAIYTTTRGNDGVGFAMPSNTAIKVYNQIVSGGRVTRGSIGITFNEARSRNPVLLKESGANFGMFIEDVQPGGPAERAGLQTGDLITEVNGQSVKTGSDLVNPIAETSIGQKIRLSYMRDKQKHDVSLTVEDRTKVFPNSANAAASTKEEEQSSDFGLHIDTLTPEMARRMGLEAKGVVVTDVEPTSFAEDLGFVPRDLIVEVNHVSIADAADYKKAMTRLKPGQNVVFRVMRRGGERFLTVMLAGTVPDSK